MALTPPLFSSPFAVVKVIEAKLEELNANKGATGGVATPAPAAPRVTPIHLQQLCDMGFSRELTEEALVATSNDLGSAMEWMLSHQPSASGSSGRGVCVCVCVDVLVCVLC